MMIVIQSIKMRKRLTAVK
ncbi:unnamed protein product [Timema podura]|uniref:Uncharacterized protein n=1 Tax=Timema podura TaxID=61482 RepID=A0ABN7PE53_TIMPD|nr:unnamed protein product [Timema podura]